MVEYTAVAVLFMFITAIFFVLTYYVELLWLKMFMGSMASLMIVGDFNLARVIVEDIDPTKTAFINVLNMFYIISVVFVVTAFVVMAFIIFIRMLMYLKELPKMKRNERKEAMMRR